MASMGLSDQVRTQFHQIMSDPSVKKFTLSEDSLYPKKSVYNVFLDIIKKSGEEISGQVYDFDHSCVGIRLPIDYEVSGQSEDDYRATTNKDGFITLQADLSQYNLWIPIDEIASMTLMSSLHPQKFAFENNDSKNEPIVHVKFKEKENLPKEFTAAFAWIESEQKSMVRHSVWRPYGIKNKSREKKVHIPTVVYNLIPTSFKFKRSHPKNKNSTYYFYSISDVQSIRQVGTSASVRAYEKGRTEEIKGSLKPLLLDPLSNIVSEYLSKVGPAEIPEDLYQAIIEDSDK